MTKFDTYIQACSRLQKGKHYLKSSCLQPLHLFPSPPLPHRATALRPNPVSDVSLASNTPTRRRGGPATRTRDAQQGFPPAPHAAPRHGGPARRARRLATLKRYTDLRLGLGGSSTRTRVPCLCRGVLRHPFPARKLTGGWDAHPHPPGGGWPLRRRPPLPGAGTTRTFGHSLGICPNATSDGHISSVDTSSDARDEGRSKGCYIARPLTPVTRDARWAVT
eukprot:344207-Pyramimonas_sp.AAC.2